MKIRILKYLKIGCLIIGFLFIACFILIYLFLSDVNDDVQLEDASGNVAIEDIKAATTLTSPEKNTEIPTQKKIEKNNLEDVSGMQFICIDIEDSKNIQLWRFEENGKYLFSFITRYIANRKLDHFTLNKINGKEWIESKKGFEYELIRDEQLDLLLGVKIGERIRFDFTHNNIITLFTPKLDNSGENIWDCKDFNNLAIFSQHINKAILELNKTIY